MRNPSSTAAATPRRFGHFELRPNERALLADGAPVTLGVRAFDLLVAFTDRPRTLITKDELLATVWQGFVVEENNLQVQVSTLRKILGQDALTTIPGRGYQFNLAVVQCDGDTPAAGTGADVGERARAQSERMQVPEARGNLPSRLPSLFGRANDVAAIVALLREHPLVTISGAGGIGKTRVAQEVARHLIAEPGAGYPDGVWWVELAALADGSLVASAVAQAIGAQIPNGDAGPPALGARLAAYRALLVLDNCEHVADAVAELVDTLLAGAPRLSILLTSQETLRATDEQVYRLGGLAVPGAASLPTGAKSGAIELFEARARAVQPRFALTAGNLPAVIEICRRLDGIPLAIELAAARLPLLGVEGLRARLHELFDLLTGGARVVLRRHQTLRATLEWSHALLTPDERTVFRRLGAFTGGFTLEAAQHVASDERIDPWDTLDHLGALVDKSLVLAEGDPIPRYRMLETTRAYALERLAEAGEMQATLRRHAHAVLALLQPFEQFDWRWRATGGAEPAARAELDNLRAALEWAGGAAEGPLAIALAGASYSVWWSSAHLAEGFERCHALRRYIDSEIPATAVARFWLTITVLGLYSIRRESYEAAVRAAALFRDLGDEQRRFEALTLAAIQGSRFATIQETADQIDEASRLEQPKWPARQRAKLFFARCFWFARQGRFNDALASAQRQVAICRDEGVEVAALYAMSNVTFMESLTGQPLDALEHARAAIPRLHAVGADDGAGHLYYSELIALLLLGRPGEALIAARNAYPRLSQEGDQHRLLLPLALVAALQGKVELAARLAAFDDAREARSGENPSIAAAHLRTPLEARLASALSVEARARLAAEGVALRDEDAFRLALGDGT
jgi:predicted ATPase/DNA-binding winged helix-turn-helix (wHTH) protein